MNNTPIGMSPEPGRLHISKDPSRGYVEFDPILRMRDGSILPGGHGLMDIRAEVARTAYAGGMLDNPTVRDILKK